DTRERLCAHQSCHHTPPGQYPRVAEALPEEPHALIAHVRVCGGGRMGNHRLSPAGCYPHHSQWPTPTPRPTPTDSIRDTVSPRRSSDDWRGLYGRSAG